MPRELRTIGFPSAPQVNCLASPTPRTPWTNFRIGRTDAAPPFWGFVAFTPVQSVTRWFHVFSPPVRGAFQLSLTLLICYRFLGVFRVRGSCPRSSRGISNPRYSVLRHHPRRFYYGAITLFGALFQGTSFPDGRVDPGPTSPCGRPARIRLALYPFRSPLLRVSRLISFPLPTKMLQFGRLPLA